MTANFTVMVIGAGDDPRRVRLTADLVRRTQPLAAAGESFDIIDQDARGTLAALDAKVPAVTVVFCRKGEKNLTAPEREAIDISKSCGIAIIPVVENLTEFTDVAPESVGTFNGFELASVRDIEELGGLVLEALGLQRSKRKIFISYARRDAAEVARQLRDAFTARWYSVFLDTVSIRPGAVFQEQLMQELADSDVVVLLNSPSVKDRRYVQDEIAFAYRAGIGGVQVVWPSVQQLERRPLRDAHLSPVRLAEWNAEIEGDTVKRLTPAGIVRIVRRVAIMRTRVQQLRERQVVRPIRRYARRKGWSTVSYLGRHIELRKDDECIHLDLALGVPTSCDLQDAVNVANPDDTVPPKVGRLVYDRLGITDEQAKHLNFLGSKLNLEYLDPRTALQWTILP